MRAIITGVGHYLPEKIMSNQDLEKLVETNDEWITTRTGIKERRILEDGKGTSYMAVKAAEQALAHSSLSPNDLDLIICGTVTPDMPVPSMAAFVQRELQANNCWGFDLNGGCTGFIYAVATAAQFLETGRHNKILVIGADKMSAILNYKDRSTCILFGDGAGAAVMERSDDPTLGVEDYILHLDGTGESALNVPGGGSLQPATHQTIDENLHYITQDGKAVFKHAVAGMADVATRIMENNGLTGDDIGLFIPHQANTRIIDAVTKKMGLTEKKVVVNIAKYGNTTAGTIPIALSEAFQDGRMASGDWIIMAAFGAGFTWGSVLLKWAI